MNNRVKCVRVETTSRVTGSRYGGRFYFHENTLLSQGKYQMKRDLVTSSAPINRYVFSPYRKAPTINLYKFVSILEWAYILGLYFNGLMSERIKFRELTNSRNLWDIFSRIFTNRLFPKFSRGLIFAKM